MGKHLGCVSAEELQQLVKGLSNYTNEAMFKFENGGLSFVEMDPANVIMVGGSLKKSEFVKQEFGHVWASLNVGVNTGSLHSILKKTKDKNNFAMEDTVQFETNDEGNAVIMKVVKNKLKPLCHNFTLADIGLEEKENRIPNLAFSCRGVLPFWLWKEVILNAEGIESLRFHYDVHERPQLAQQKLFFSGTGELANYLSSDVTDAICGVFITGLKNKQRCKYSSEYLLKTIEFFDDCESLNVEFSTDYPMKVSAKDKFFIIAPRVEAED